MGPREALLVTLWQANLTAPRVQTANGSLLQCTPECHSLQGRGEHGSGSPSLASAPWAALVGPALNLETLDIHEVEEGSLPWESH